MCKRPVKSPIKANLCSLLPWSICSLVCGARQTGGISQGERGRGGEEETGCEAERAEDEKKEVE